jgi:hypothetical protein
MEIIKEVASKAGDEVVKNIEQNTSKWSELIKELVDKLTGKDMAVTYELKNLETGASGPGGKDRKCEVENQWQIRNISQT